MQTQQQKLENLNRQLRIQDVLSVLITQSTKLIELVNANQKEVNRLKVEVIKKLLMLDTTKELIKVRECISDGICNELDNDEQDQKEFDKWKESRKKEESEERHGQARL